MDGEHGSLQPLRGLLVHRVVLLQSWTWVGLGPPWDGTYMGQSPPGCRVGLPATWGSALSSPHPFPGRNYTLKSMPLPMSDVAQAYRSNPERTEEAVHKVGGCGLGLGSGERVWLLTSIHPPAAAPVLPGEEPDASRAARADLPPAAGHPGLLLRAGDAAPCLVPHQGQP